MFKYAKVKEFREALRGIPLQTLTKTKITEFSILRLKLANKVAATVYK